MYGSVSYTHLDVYKRQVVTIPAENEEELLGLVKYCEDLFNEEYSTIETPISFTAERVEVPAGQVPEEIQDNLIDAIFACQNGVTRMIPTVPDTVETSSNLAIITIAGGKAEIKILARSSSDSMKAVSYTHLDVYKRQVIPGSNPGSPTKNNG